MSAVTHIERVLMGHCLSLPAYILSDLAQIMDAARRDGAAAMREAAADAGYAAAFGGTDVREVYSAIRALPLPTGPRQVVRLTNEEIGEMSRDPAKCEHVNGLRLMDSPLQFARAIETAVLAKNGLEGGAA